MDRRSLYFLFLTIFCSTLMTQSNSHRILSILPLNSMSHNMMFEALMVGLAERGHNVDMITHFPVKNSPKTLRTVVNLDGHLDNLVNNFSIPFAKALGDDLEPYIAGLWGNDLCNLLALDDMQEFIKSLKLKDHPYDVVITEVLGANCYLGFGHLLNVPIVGLSSTVEYPWISDFLGNADNLAIVPSFSTKLDKKMDFWGRLRNVVGHYYDVWRFYRTTAEKQTEAMRKYLSPDMPRVRDIEKSIALTLVNSHPVLYGNKPLSPHLVQVAGLHVEQNKGHLTPELQKWMDESTDGVVYFTLGSLVVIETLSPDTLDAIYASFNHIKPIRVLMKIVDKGKLPPGLPDNVLTSPWIPQVQILAHKNTRVFITHGGSMGCQESLYYGVPIIGIPIYGDQFRNVESFVAKNMAVKINLNNINEDSLTQSLTALLTNPKYREHARYYSRIFRDRPMTATNTAIFWIEYVIRNGPDVLKSPALDMSWWQIELLDVYAALLLSTIFIGYLAFAFSAYAYKMCSKRNLVQSKNKKEN